MMRMPFALCLAVAVILTGCTDSGGADEPASLNDTSWILAEVLVDDALKLAVNNSGSLNFSSDGTMSGSTGCNRFNGTWTADGDALTLQPGPMTLMACPGDLPAQEAAVIAAFSATTSYRITDGTLTLQDADDNPLATYSAVAADLAESHWAATGINNGQGAVVTTAITNELTLIFGDAGTVSGFDGCGNFSGAYSTQGSAISISSLAPGPECANQEQAQYLAALGAATTYRLDGNRLELRNDSGALQAGFAATS